jgi:hypothetical protein
VVVFKFIQLLEFGQKLDIMQEQWKEIKWTKEQLWIRGRGLMVKEVATPSDTNQVFLVEIPGWKLEFYRNVIFKPVKDRHTFQQSLNTRSSMGRVKTLEMLDVQ